MLNADRRRLVYVSQGIRSKDKNNAITGLEPMSSQPLAEHPYYHSLSACLRREFGERVHRVAVDAGFSCPHLDGTIAKAGKSARGGCIYCADGARAHYVEPDAPLAEQVRAGIERVRDRFKARKYLVYFQANTNTNAPLARLRECYDAALGEQDVVGLAIGTRADCLSDEVLDMLEEYHRRTYLWLEIGLQSTNEDSLRWMNRGHELAAFVDASRRAAARSLRLCAHLILGLPGEQREDALNAARLISELGYQGLKLHMLYVNRRARLASLYQEKPFPLLDRQEYVALACDVLERVPPEIVIHRLVSDCRAEDLIEPRWLLDKRATLEAIEAEFHRRGTRQGVSCSIRNG
jgi:radical SAM protein (TIGR01212 family)